MTASGDRDQEEAQSEKVLSTVEARQGKTGTGARYVLVVSIAALAVGFAILYLAFFGF
ncbi:MAG TPA: hypothetical protein VG843_13365 [Rhizomicrobium sp.]|jgi:hypothetical protein|nr:hypothetical protein [Rhizomicrobium sp.]